MGNPDEKTEKPGRKTARECALTLLEHSDRTSQEIRRKLRERHYDPEEIEETVAFLEEYRYVDDAAYAERYIRGRGRSRSTRRLCAELEQKGVDREMIRACLSEHPVDEDEQILAFLAKKGYDPETELEAGEYRRLTAALCRRGYSGEAVRRLTDRMKPF